MQIYEHSISEIQQIKFDPMDFLKLLYFPSAKIRKKTLKILKDHPSGKYQKISRANWSQHIPENIKEEARWYILFFLIDHSFSFYYRAYRHIRKNRKEFHSILLQGLIHPEEVIQQHCARLLHELFPHQYPREDILAILSTITPLTAEIFVETFRNRLQNPNLPWYEREDIITKLGAFSTKIAVPFIKKFVADPDHNVRIAVARALQKHPHFDAFLCLFSLLMDFNPEVKNSALKSLETINPNYFGRKSAYQILQDVGNEELLISYEQAFKPIDLERLWNKKDLDHEIIAQFIHENSQKILKTACINHQNLSNSAKSKLLDIEKRKLNTLENIIISRGYPMMQVIENLLQDNDFRPHCLYLQNLRNRIQSHYTVIQSSGWKILL
ncbi:MAG: HEAT repeat domain-containing protein [Promethearchaeota archaeon]